MGDSVKALQFINTYFEKEKPENYVARDYALKAQLINKDSASRNEASALWEKAVVLDTLPEHKLEYMHKLAANYKQAGNRSREAYWLGKIYETKKEPSNLDLYYWGLAHYAAKEYPQADSVFALYAAKYPDQIHGYLWRAKSCAFIDSSMENGLAIPWYTKVIEIAGANAAANKTILIQAYGYIGAYLANVKKDYPVALDNFEKILELQPDDADASKYAGILKKWIKAGKGTESASATTSSNSNTDKQANEFKKVND